MSTLFETTRRTAISPGVDGRRTVNLGHWPALDGLRGVAVILVFIFHSMGTLITPMGPIAYMGWLGVDLFFVLSGFLITSILLRARDTENYYKVFYLRRALRILPLYYLALTLSLLTTRDHYTFRAQLWFWLNLSNPRDGLQPYAHPVAVALLEPGRGGTVLSYLSRSGEAR